MKDSDNHDEVDGSINIFSSKDVNKQSFDNPPGKYTPPFLFHYSIQETNLFNLANPGMNIDYIGLPPD